MVCSLLQPFEIWVVEVEGISLKWPSNMTFVAGILPTTMFHVMLPLTCWSMIREMAYLPAWCMKITLKLYIYYRDPWSSTCDWNRLLVVFANSSMYTMYPIYVPICTYIYIYVCLTYIFIYWCLWLSHLSSYLHSAFHFRCKRPRLKLWLYNFDPMTRGLKLFRRDDSDGLKSSFQHFFRKGVIITSVNIWIIPNENSRFATWAVIECLGFVGRWRSFFS